MKENPGHSHERLKYFYDLEDEVRRLLLEKRVVMVVDEICIELAEGIARELMYVSLISKDPIKVILNSVGGEVYAGLLVYNTIRDIVRQGIDVTVEVRGLAASMGCIILQSGSKRTSARATRFLIHEVASFDYGKVSEMEEQVEELRKVNNLLRDILAEKTGRQKEEIDKVWAKKDVWHSSEEALKFGLIDEIVD
jgi:ATP-dependent Clp protease protease subunit